jgi:hypothetical protein
MIKKSEIVPENHRTAMVQTQLGVGGGYLKYDPDNVRNFFIKYCVRTEKPLSMTCDPLFEEFITESLHPQFRKLYHKSDHIFKYVLQVIEEYQIKDKIFAIAFDNASNCNAAIRLLCNTLQSMMNGAFFLHEICLSYFKLNC